MHINTLRNIDERDLDNEVWRYLTFPKYISLLTYRAIWFSKLSILTDKYEGAMPAANAAIRRSERLEHTDVFPPSLLAQLDKRNVDDGRELTVANCWFLSECESEKMWTEYANGAEGIAIKSTIRALSQNVFCDPRHSMVGRVKYVDLETHAMRD
jgi:hypothetical protein